MMRKNRKNWFFFVAGLVTIVVGLLLAFRFSDSEGVMQVLPFIMLGVGCGAFGYGGGGLLQSIALRHDPELERELEIEKKDERRVLIATTAKAKAYDVMNYLWAGLLLCFALMRVELVPLLMMVAAYLFIEGVAIYHMVKLEKKL